MASVSFTHIAPPSQGEEGPSCMICRDEAKGATVQHDGHCAFHEECLRQWVSLGHPSCPGCRQTIARVNDMALAVWQPPAARPAAPAPVNRDVILNIRQRLDRGEPFDAYSLIEAFIVAKESLDADLIDRLLRILPHQEPGSFAYQAALTAVIQIGSLPRLNELLEVHNFSQQDLAYARIDARIRIQPTRVLEHRQVFEAIDERLTAAMQDGPLEGGDLIRHRLDRNYIFIERELFLAISLAVRTRDLDLVDRLLPQMVQYPRFYLDMLCQAALNGVPEIVDRLLEVHEFSRNELQAVIRMVSGYIRHRPWLLNFNNRPFQAVMTKLRRRSWRHLIPSRSTLINAAIMVIAVAVGVVARNMNSA